jgi:hypothetical protein
MWLVGTVYNFCRAHRSLRLVGSGATERRWIERTPAQAAGLTDHRWSLYEVLSLAVPQLQYPSDAADDPDGCWRPLMGLDYSPRLIGVLPQYGE